MKGMRTFVLILLVLLFVNIWFPKEVTMGKPLARLPVPIVAKTYLPQPLEILPYTTSILGAQTFDEVDIVTFINIERNKRGIPPLRIHPLLMKAASMRASTIMKHQNFSHVDPYEHIELASVLPRVDYHFQYASENIGMGGVSGPDFVNGFMNSTAHRENLLRPDLSDTGVAVATGAYKQYYVNVAVQLFAIPGSKEEFLGYKESDKALYAKALTSVEAKLDPLVWFFHRLIRSPDYTDDTYQQLVKHKEMLVKLNDKMKREEAFETADALLVMEYNNTLN